MALDSKPPLSVEQAAEHEWAWHWERLDQLLRIKDVMKFTTPVPSDALLQYLKTLLETTAAFTPPPEESGEGTAADEGTVNSLIRRYETDPDSPIHKNRFKVQATYRVLLKRLATDIGQLRIADLNAERIQRIYDEWIAGGKVAMGHALIGRFRMVCHYGMKHLEDPECTRLSTILHTMRFKLPEAHVEEMTAEHAKAIRAAAHKKGWPSIALAQAFQFELGLRQVDTIGEWVPLAEQGNSEIIYGNEKWVRGLRWSQINEDLIFQHTTTNKLRKPEEIKEDLNRHPMIKDELERVRKRLGKLPTSGPLIICEATDKPFSTNEFRRKWRIIAKKAGVPDEVRNADSIKGKKNTAAKRAAI
jgi:hypothetical protein